MHCCTFTLCLIQTGLMLVGAADSNDNLVDLFTTAAAAAFVHVWLCLFMLAKVSGY